eukprot:6046761-Pyramimonas_sp.AAC.1
MVPALLCCCCYRAGVGVFGVGVVNAIVVVAVVVAVIDVAVVVGAGIVVVVVVGVLIVGFIAGIAVLIGVGDVRHRWPTVNCHPDVDDGDAEWGRGRGRTSAREMGPRRTRTREKDRRIPSSCFSRPRPPGPPSVRRSPLRRRGHIQHQSLQSPPIARRETHTSRAKRLQPRPVKCKLVATQRHVR